MTKILATSLVLTALGASCATSSPSRKVASDAMTLTCRTGSDIVPEDQNFTVSVSKADYLSDDKTIEGWFEVPKSAGEVCTVTKLKSDEEESVQPFSFKVYLKESRETFWVKGQNFNEGSGRITGKTSFFVTPNAGKGEAQATCMFR